MSGMNEFLANYYGTGTQPQAQPDADDLQKQASVELFAKLAASKNIDLSTLPDTEVQSLYNDFLKQAAAEPLPTTAAAPTTEAVKVASTVVDEAKKELDEKRAAAEKLAEADFIGRAIAHAYVDELKNIAAAEKTAAAKVAGKDDKEEDKKSDKKEDDKGDDKGDKGDKKLPPWLMGKKASAVDLLAAQAAVKVASDGGFDSQEAMDRVGAILTLGPKESVKTAGVFDVEAATQIRALELLELAGYHVTWAQ